MAAEFRQRSQWDTCVTMYLVPLIHMVNTHGSCPRYQRAVSHLGLLAVSPPYIDELGTGSMITLSQAILPAR